MERHYASRESFDEALATWFATAVEGEAIEPGVHAQKPSVRVEHEGIVFELKAETNRAAVGRYLEFIRNHPTAEWCVVANRRGVRNKLGVGQPPVTIQQFWMYVRRAARSVGQLRRHSIGRHYDVINMISLVRLHGSNGSSDDGWVT